MSENIIITKTKRDRSPQAIDMIKLIPSTSLSEEIIKIENTFNFKKNYLITLLEELINWYNLESDLENQRTRNADVKKNIARLQKYSQLIITDLAQCGTVTRDKLSDTIHAIISGELTTELQAESEFLNLVTPHSFEDIIVCFNKVCTIAHDRIRQDNGGNEANTSFPKKIIFILAEKFEDGTGVKPTNYSEGKFQQFLIALNPLLISLNPGLTLGTEETIQRYASEILTTLAK